MGFSFKWIDLPALEPQFSRRAVSLNRILFHIEPSHEPSEEKGEEGPGDLDTGIPKREKVPWDLRTSTGHHNCEKLGLSCSIGEVLSSLGGGSSPWRCLHQFSEASAGPGGRLDGICSFRKSPPTPPGRMPCLFLWIGRFTCSIFALSLSLCIHTTQQMSATQQMSSPLTRTWEEAKSLELCKEAGLSLL